MENEQTEPTEVEAVAVTETPEAKPEAKPEPPSRRDALAKALAAIDKREADGVKAAAPAEKADQEPAEEAEAKPADKPDAKEPEKAENGQPRNADGTFAAKAEGEKPEGDAKPAEGQADEKPEAKADGAPARFSADAKAEWDKAPASVRGEIGRAIRELESGIQQKDEALAPFKPYIDLAQQHGVDLKRTLDGYVEIDRLLGTDPRRGMERIASNMGMTLPDLIAMVTGGESTSTPADYQVLQMQQEMDQLRQQTMQMQQALQQQREDAIAASIDQFAASRPRFNELLPEITRMLETGFAENLEKAYDMADRLNPVSPSVPEQPVDTTPPAPQTRTAKSITGAPGSGSDPARRRPADTRKSAIAAAFDSVGL